MLRTRGCVIRIHAVLKLPDSFKERHEDIHEEDKEKGGEGASLLDTPVEINTGRGSTREGGVAVGIGKESTDAPDNIFGNTDMSKEGKNNPMVTAIKSFGEVVEEEIIMTSFIFSSIKSFVKKEYVILHGTTRNIAGLVGVNDIGKRENDEGVNGGGNQTVVGVGDDNRSGVFHCTKTFFGKKVEQTPVKIFGRGSSTTANTSSTTEDDWTRDVNKLSVDRERDAVGPRGGIVRIKNDFFHELQVELAEGGVSVFGSVRGELRRMLKEGN